VVAPIISAPDAAFDDAAVARVVRRRPPTTDLGYEPPLDGLRAVAVLAVCFYHARFEWIPGGFLGVSTFFTLSGFLITTLLLAERRRSGSIDVRRFSARRFRRLLPAAWTTLLVVLVMGALGVWDATQLRSLRGDVPAAVAELSNWWFILQDRTYGALFEAPSPTEHFWSLAIEQQFYLLYPVMILGLVTLVRRRPRLDFVRVLVVTLGALTVVSLLLNWRFAATSIPRAYFGTDTRLAELTIGGLLATVGLRRLRPGAGSVRTAMVLGGGLAVVVTIALWHTASVGAAWLYPLGLLATAVCSVGLIAGALQPGPVRNALSLAPVVALGRISYGVYLLHWPVFLWLTPVRTGLAQWPLFGLRMTVTVGAAVVLYLLLERPVRSGGGTPAKVFPRAVVPALALLLVATVLVTNDVPGPDPIEEAAATTTSIPPAPAPLRTLFIGDATAAAWGPAAVGSAEAPLTVKSIVNDGCGLVALGFVALPDGSTERNTDRCGEVQDLWVASVTAERPELVIVSGGLRDVADRRTESDQPWTRLGDPALDDLLLLELSEFFERLAATGVPVAVATIPQVNNSVLPPPPPAGRDLPAGETERALYQVATERALAGGPGPGFPENDPARIDRWNQLLRRAAAVAELPVIDVAAVTQAWPGGPFDPERRSADGVGYSELGQRELSAALAPAMRSARPAVPRPDAVAGFAASVALPNAPPPTPRRTVTAGAPVPVLVVGDSVALDLGVGLRDAGGDGGLTVSVGAKLGCPIARGGEYKFMRDVISFEDECDWSGFFPELLDAYDPAVVVLGSGIWEVVDRRLPGDDRLRSVGEPTFDRYFTAELLSAIDALASRGATVVLLTYPLIESGRGQGFSDLPESDPARMARLNELIVEAAALRPGVATVVDFGGWMASQAGGGLDPSIRSDGVHLTAPFIDVAGAWLRPQVEAIGRRG
jgi:peptidoglycan/LPS O-acetylase OafA/YrhL